MTIEFFIHSEIDDTNELRAIYRMANLLLEQYQNSDDYFATVFNLEPQREAAWEQRQLTQLDCLLISENFWAIIDFKRYESPFRVDNIDHRWRFIDENGRPIKGGWVAGGRAMNPFGQARKARGRWGYFLEDAVNQHLNGKYQQTPWAHLNSWVIFAPRIHPDTDANFDELIPVRDNPFLFHRE